MCGSTLRTAVRDSAAGRRSEAPSPDTRMLFCRSAAVLGRPRQTEVRSPNTRTLFCRSASSSAAPVKQKSTNWKRLRELCRVIGDGASVRWGRPRTAALRRRAPVCLGMELLIDGGGRALTRPTEEAGVGVRKTKREGADLPQDQRPCLYLSSPMEN